MRIIIFLIFCLITPYFTNYCFGDDSDLDDGIAIDDPIGDYDSLRRDFNIQYIIRSSKNRYSNSSENYSHPIFENNGLDIAGQGIVVILPGADVDSVYNVFEGDENIAVNVEE